jgi:ATP-dependent DNA ligase
MLKKPLKRKYSRILYLDHVEGDGRLLVEQIVAKDLEGIVCKRKHARSRRSLASSYFQCRSERRLVQKE